MKKADLKKFKKLLEKQRSDYLLQVDRTSADCSRKMETADEVDVATRGNQVDMGVHLTNRGNTYLKKIKEALARIEEGTFGICTDCGDEIELRRLEARPTAELCIRCKEAEELNEKLS